MNREEKSAEVEYLKDILGKAEHAFLVDFKGLNVQGATELRAELRKSEATLRVVKNRLALRAVEGTPMGNLQTSFVGQTAVAYTYGEDVVGLARALRDFAKEYDVPEVKAGVVSGEAIDISRFSEIAGLPSRDELLAKALWLMQYPVTGLVIALDGIIRKLVIALDQVRAKKDTAGEA